MRDQLRNIVGRLVYIHGKPCEARSFGEGRDICLKRPTVIPWDENAPLDFKAKGIKCDHLWIRALKPGKVCMYQESVSIARVGYYTRANGSLDIGCQDIARLYNADRLLDLFCDTRLFQKEKQLIQCEILLNELNEMFEHHGKLGPDGSRLYVYSEFLSITEVKAKLKRLKAELDRRIAQKVIQSSPKASKVQPGSALFLGNNSTDLTLSDSAIDRLLRGPCD